MKLATFFISSNKLIFIKLFGVSESSITIKVTSHGSLFIILLTSAVICKQIFLYGKGIVQFFQNCKYYNVGQDHFREPL